MPNCRGSFSARTQRLVSVNGNGPQNLYPCEVCGRHVAAIRNGLFEWIPVSHPKLEARRSSKGRRVKVTQSSGKALPPSRFKDSRGKKSQKRSALKRSR
jgi:hypothetical protein